jgi:hypothetical protein
VKPIDPRFSGNGAGSRFSGEMFLNRRHDKMASMANAIDQWGGRRDRQWSGQAAARAFARPLAISLAIGQADRLIGRIIARLLQRVDDFGRERTISAEASLEERRRKARELVQAQVKGLRRALAEMRAAEEALEPVEEFAPAMLIVGDAPQFTDPRTAAAMRAVPLIVDEDEWTQSYIDGAGRLPWGRSGWIRWASITWRSAVMMILCGGAFATPLSGRFSSGRFL